MKDEPKDSQMAFIWNLARFADATSDATNYQPNTQRTRHFNAIARARKHARRLCSLAGFYPLDPDSRKALADLVGEPAPQRKAGAL